MTIIDWKDYMTFRDLQWTNMRSIGTVMGPQLYREIHLDGQNWG